MKLKTHGNIVNSPDEKIFFRSIEIKKWKEDVDKLICTTQFTVVVAVMKIHHITMSDSEKHCEFQNEKNKQLSMNVQHVELIKSLLNIIRMNSLTVFLYI